VTPLDVAVIGAGQSGLAVGYYLRRTDRTRLVADGAVSVDGTFEALDAVIWCTGFASATLIGVGRTARQTIEEVDAALI
jgi:cation diffusion facilitator CzcD-associated flavoprotein CzcO